MDNIDKKIQNAKINDSQDFDKILGIYFAKDIRKTAIYNWNICLTEIKNQIQQLSRQHLSLRGKAILLNFLTLSKVTFSSNVFPVPTTLQQKQKASFSNIYGNSIKQSQSLEKHYSFHNTQEE